MPANTLLLFGATGDLAQRMLLPSLFGLDGDGLLPPSLRIVGTARSNLDDDGFRAAAGTALERFVDAERRPAERVERFLSRLSYVPLDASDRDQFGRLAEAVRPDERGLAILLSTAPSLFSATIGGLESAGLSGSNVRLALEKPLGDRPRLQPRDQRCRRRRLSGGAHVPDRPLSRQGDCPEPARAALRRQPLRADVECRRDRSCPDHRVRDRRTRRPGRLL